MVTRAERSSGKRRGFTLAADRPRERVDLSAKTGEALDAVEVVRQVAKCAGVKPLKRGQLPEHLESEGARGSVISSWDDASRAAVAMSSARRTWQYGAPAALIGGTAAAAALRSKSRLMMQWLSHTGSM